PLWRPFLQTPPFPEFPSGHSVISTAAATVLTYLFGDDFHFSDTIETEFDLPSRSFHSFLDAAKEASASRYYAGIHFMMSIQAGTDLGMKTGNDVIDAIFNH